MLDFSPVTWQLLNIYPLLETIIPEPSPSSFKLLLEEKIEFDLVLIFEIPTTHYETFSNISATV